MTTNGQLARSASEVQGVSSSAILDFVEAVDQQIDALHSFMLVRHGNVIAEGWWAPYGPTQPHVMFSLSKSFASTAVGLAAAEGRLSIDDTVLSFFSDDAPANVSANLAAMRVRHLLSMSTGNEEDTTAYLRDDPDGNWVRAFLARPVEREPGTHFVYNSGATYMLSAIVQKLTGERLLDYLQPRLFGPLGIEGATWEQSPQGIDTGGWGLSIKTEDIARFGQLYLQKGMWNGAQIVPAAWVEEATSAQVSNAGRDAPPDWLQGYGYQFWRCRNNAYRGDGAFGQYCVVMPDQDAVLAITSGVEDMQAVLDLVWKHLLPAMGDAPAPANSAGQMALARKLGSLALPTVKGQLTSPAAAEVSGKSYTLEPNDQHIQTVSFDFGNDTNTITLRDARGEHQVVCGNGAWSTGTTEFATYAARPLTPDSHDRRPVAASGAWIAEDTYQAQMYFYGTPFCLFLTAQFAGNTLHLDQRVNVSFGPTERPQLVGTAA